MKSSLRAFNRTCGNERRVESVWQRRKERSTEWLEPEFYKCTPPPRNWLIGAVDMNRTNVTGAIVDLLWILVPVDLQAGCIGAATMLLL